VPPGWIRAAAVSVQVIDIVGRQVIGRGQNRRWRHRLAWDTCERTALRLRVESPYRLLIGAHTAVTNVQIGLSRRRVHPFGRNKSPTPASLRHTFLVVAHL
jgi:hypothetical protein